MSEEFDSEVINSAREAEYEASKVALRKQDEKTKRWSRLLNTQDGRDVIADILDFTGIYAESYTGQAASTMYNEGRRSVGLNVMAEISKASKDNLYNMLADAAERQNA